MKTNAYVKPHSFQAWLLFMRPKTFWIAACPVFVGSAFSCMLDAKFNFWTFLLTLLGAVLIQAMSNMVNDYAYNVRKAENGNRVGLPRATTEGWISMTAAKKMISFCIALCIAVGILLLTIGGLPIAVIAFLSILAGYCYMGGPKPIAYTPFGEFLVFLFYGLVAVGGTYWLQTAQFNTLILVPGAALGLLGAAVLLVNNFRDVEHDVSVGRQTLVAFLGKRQAIFAYSCMIYIPFIVVGWLVPLNNNYWPLLFILLALPRASFLPQQLKRATAETTTPIMLKTIKLEFFFGFLLALGALASFFLLWPSQSLSVSSIFGCPI